MLRPAPDLWCWRRRRWAGTLIMSKPCARCVWHSRRVWRYFGGPTSPTPRVPHSHPARPFRAGDDRVLPAQSIEGDAATRLSACAAYETQLGFQFGGQNGLAEILDPRPEQMERFRAEGQISPHSDLRPAVARRRPDADAPRCCRTVRSGWLPDLPAWNNRPAHWHDVARFADHGGPRQGCGSERKINLPHAKRPACGDAGSVLAQPRSFVRRDGFRCGSGAARVAADGGGDRGIHRGKRPACWTLAWHVFAAGGWSVWEVLELPLHPSSLRALAGPVGGDGDWRASWCGCLQSDPCCPCSAGTARASGKLSACLRCACCSRSACGWKTWAPSCLPLRGC